MNYKKEMLNKEVAVWYISDNELTIFFTDGSDMRIRHGTYSWRVTQNGEIVMSSADIFAQFADSETAAFWPMQEKLTPTPLISMNIWKKCLMPSKITKTTKVKSVKIF